MRTTTRCPTIPALALACVLAMLSTVSGASQAATLIAQAAPLPAEPNPPGDIPDTQVFVDYHSSLGYSIKVPEGWSRQGRDGDVTFTSTYDGVAIQLAPAAAAPSLASVKQEQLAALEKSPAAVRITKVAAVELPAGSAIVISFSSNSEPNAVTGKAIRLENDRYLLWRNGRLATLTLWAPLGADNVDQWRLMSRSFRWR
jgi:hypothetical protein